jgi:hypothetical protein
MADAILGSEERGIDCISNGKLALYYLRKAVGVLLSLVFLIE